MDENQDVGASGAEPFEGFEDRVRELLGEAATTRGVSPVGVIRGARRRRVRHRAAAAGSSLAVLGVAAGAVAFGGHSAGPSRTTAQVAPASAPKTSAPPAPKTSAPPPKTCMPSVTGTVPATTTTTVDGLDFVTISGTTMGIPWAQQIHVFPTEQAHKDWMNGKPAGTYPPEATAAFHSGQVAQFRTPGVQAYGEVGAPSTEKEYFSFGSADGLGPGTPVPGRSNVLNGKTVPGLMSYKAYLIGAWMDPKVDHLCLQTVDHAEFVPVYRIQGAAFIEFGYSMADHPEEVIGYDAGGKVVGTSTAVMGPLNPEITFQPLNWPKE